jgi:WD40 repeat protein
MEQLLHVLKGHSSWVNSISYSRDGQFLASASYDKTIKLWRLGTAKPFSALTWHHSYVGFVVFSPDGQTLASRGDNTIKLWYPSTGKQLCSLQGHSDWVNGVAFNPQGNILASCSRDMTIKIWQLDG